MVPSIEGPGRPSERELAAMLAAVGDPIRLRILRLIGRKPLAVHEICSALSMAQPRVSHHLAILRGQGLVDVQVEGRRRLYRWPPGKSGGALDELHELLARWLIATEPPVEVIGTSKEAIEEGKSPPAPAALEDFLL